MKWLRYVIMLVVIIWGAGNGKLDPDVGKVVRSRTVPESYVPMNRITIDHLGEIIEVDNYELNTVYKQGDLVLLEKNEHGTSIVSKYRTKELRVLFAIFIVSVLLVTGAGGIAPIVGLIISFLIIFQYVLPEIINGSNPLQVTLIACIGVVGVGFYITHGFTMKTSIAVVSSLLSLTVIALLASIFSKLTGLTGFSSEEVSFLVTQLGENLQVYYLLMAGIIIGALGILDDVTISQVSVVEEVYKANKKVGRWELYKSAMSVGHDHIASIVNTLVLVYAGVSLPLLLLFADSNRSWTTLLNYEPVTEEIVRTLVSSIGLIMAIPITTIIASYWYTKKIG